jgi:hypothetical protein
VQILERRNPNSFIASKRNDFLTFFLQDLGLPQKISEAGLLSAMTRWQEIEEHLALHGLRERHVDTSPLMHFII